jgi:hypothetical protein
VKVEYILPKLAKIEYQGLSSHAKPTHIIGSDAKIGPGSTFYELDTWNRFRYDDANINSATGNGWWPA